MGIALYDQGSVIPTMRGTFYAIVSGSGVPSVIFDSGLSNTADVWFAVAPAIAQITSVYVYDRANIGKSHPQPTPRTSQDCVDDLHELLLRSPLSPPYILVGHSFGGTNMRLYAAQHPEHSYALVLVDAPHEGMDEHYAPLLSQTVWDAYLQQWNSEQIDLSKSANQVAATALSPAIHIIVISATKHSYPRGWPEDQLETIRIRLQHTLASQLSGSKHVMATRSGHMIQIDEPDLIRKIITDLISDYRASRESFVPIT
jgi:pimeloyl-ACP methyl ester carboxylesterase